MSVGTLGLKVLTVLVALGIGVGCDNGGSGGEGGYGIAGSGGSDPSVAGTGGGGEGGSAGSGGSAGEGGSGGTGGLCGNGEPDDGEACDDGNTVSGDGCAADCTWDGTCAAPLEYLEYAVKEGDQSHVRGMLPNRDGLLDGTCSTAQHGSEMVYRYEAPAEGRLSFGVGSFDSDTIVYTRRSCADAGSERDCSAQGIARLLPMKSGEEIFLIVDGPSSGEDGTYLLSSQFFPYKGVGESCGPGNICQSGLDCIDRACVNILPPELHDATALRGGEGQTDVVILATAADRVGNATAFLLRFLDAQGVAIDLDLDDPFWDSASRTLATAFDQRSLYRTQPGVPFRAWTTLEGLLERHPEIVSVGVSVSNRGVDSEERIVGLEDQPLRSQGEACGFHEPSDSCLGELLCRERPEGGGASCESLADLRRTACLSAPVLEGSGSVAGIRNSRSLWEPPVACWDPRYPEEVRGNGRPDGLVRLSLSSAATRLTLSTDNLETSGDSIMYLFAGCGETEPPIACDHLGGTTFDRGSKLILEELPAGEYLVVVDTPGSFSAEKDPFLLEVDIE